MLSDSLFEACEEIWKAVHHYDYSSYHKNELITAITEMAYITYQLDRMKTGIWTKDDMRKYVLERWNSGLSPEEWYEQVEKKQSKT